MFPVFTFQFFPFFQAFSNYPIQGSPYILSSTWASSLSESLCFGVLAFHFQPNQDYIRSVCLDRWRSDTRFVFSGTNPRSLLFLLDQGSPSPISIYSSLGHVNTFIITSIYLFIYRIMILRIEKEKHILRCPETGVTVCWSWMSGPSLTHAVRP